MSRTAWWQPRARAWRWPPPTLRTCSTGCCSNGTVRSEEHTSELQSPCNLVCRLLSSEEHTSELQSPCNLVCRLLLENKKTHAPRYCRDTDPQPFAGCKLIRRSWRARLASILRRPPLR